MAIYLVEKKSLCFLCSFLVHFILYKCLCLSEVILKCKINVYLSFIKIKCTLTITRSKYINIANFQTTKREKVVYLQF